MAPRARIHPVHIVALVSGVLALLFATMILKSGFHYVGTWEHDLKMAGVPLVIGLAIVFWVTTKFWVHKAIGAGVLVVVLGFVGFLLHTRRGEANALLAANLRENAVSDMCATGVVPAEVAPTPGSPKVRILRRRADSPYATSFMDLDGYDAWNRRHVPPFVACVNERSITVGTKQYVSDKDGSKSTFTRTKVASDIRLFDLTERRVIFETTLSGSEPGPFPHIISFGRGSSPSGTHGDAPGRAEVMAALSAHVGRP
jgi:hypothetical protein